MTRTMIFDDIIGNEDVKRALTGMVGSGRIPHALMFYGNDGCGAIQFAQAFLELLMGSQKIGKMIHPDVKYIFPVSKGSKVSTDKVTSEAYLPLWRELYSENPYFLENEMNEAFGIEGRSSLIAVAEAKTVLDLLSMTALEKGYRAAVIYLPEKMNQETANRLLKSIEEPPELTQLIFITHAPEKVLTTISSRCQGIRLLPLSKEEVAKVLVERFGKDPETAAAAAEVSGGSVGQALSWLSMTEDTDEEFRIFRDMMSALLSRNLSAALDIADTLGAIGSREKAKAFCRYVSEALRKIFMLQQGLEALSGVSAREAEVYAEYSKRCKRSFPRMALPYLDRAVMLIERNINMKIMFCDLVDRLYVLV